MTNLSTLSAKNLVFTSNNELHTDSTIVAKYFGKRHSDVIRKIESLDIPVDFSSAHFCVHDQKINIGNGALRESKAYEMTKDGFMFLVMGFTGQKAARMKITFIQAFNKMAEQLAKGSRIQPPAQANTLTLPDFHRQRILLCVENGEIVGKKILDSDEVIMNRKSYINYFKEPDIGFNDIDQLVELSNSVNERIRVQVRNMQ